MSAPLTPVDCSAVVRLVREVCDRWDDPVAWRSHLLAGACRLVDGHVGLMVADREVKRAAFGRPTVVAVVGLPGPARALVRHAVSRLRGRAYDDVSANFMPGMERLHGDVDRDGWATAPRAALTDAAAYHAAPMYRDFWRHVDCDDYVTSIRIVDAPRRPEALNVHFRHGAPPLSPRQVALLRVLHDEIAPLVGVRLATEAHLCRDGLSRRLNETLSLLLEGRSEKEAARALGLSPRTVHEYVTALYAHFRVSSRAELLAYFIRRTPTPRAPAPIETRRPIESEREGAKARR